MRLYLIIEQLLWLLLSAALFVFVIPVPTGTIVRIVLGFIFYLIVRMAWSRRGNSGAEEADVNNKMTRLAGRIKQLSSAWRTPGRHLTKQENREKEEEKEAEIKSQL